jgi:hypothetical protein
MPLGLEERDPLWELIQDLFGDDVGACGNTRSGGLALWSHGRCALAGTELLALVGTAAWNPGPERA